eukprot:gnl/MRDRNA2_/MRDRNA2_81973_c0_seq1.p1 gnl/MRDRNA2_/MRDRNA2_81973_c0~~gnl/MRDRNA2_/MRDRNA2_81973_c0_seq1.p1  ORF type:complete len:663 (+),score=109.33 gnl/MRDRNA2_/MRDRNA2_81973_c0_seq1:93-2081(+)
MSFPQNMLSPFLMLSSYAALAAAQDPYQVLGDSKVAMAIDAKGVPQQVIRHAAPLSHTDIIPAAGASSSSQLKAATLDTFSHEGESHQFHSRQSPHLFSGENMDSLVKMSSMIRSLMLKRFDDADTNKDRTVTLQEMKVAFNAILTQEEEMLKAMLARAGSTQNGTALSRRSMVAYVNRLQEPSLMHVSLNQFTAKDFHALPFPITGSKDCGPQGHRCRRKGPLCFNSASPLTWMISELCQKECACEPDDETKHFTRLGFSGALAAAASHNTGGPDLALPQCNDGWEAFAMKDTAQFWLTGAEYELTKIVSYGFMAAQRTPPKYAEKILQQHGADVEVMLYKSSSHQLLAGTQGKVCMVTWLPTESWGDWKANLILTEENFEYGPGKVKKGYNLMYKALRDKIQAKVMDECCSASFHAEKFIISGHSMGGGLSLLNAVDMVRNWNCLGDDLTSNDIVVTQFGAAPAETGSFVDAAVTCEDPSNCLPGRVVHISTQHDAVGAGVNLKTGVTNSLDTADVKLSKDMVDVIRAIPAVSTLIGPSRATPTKVVKCKGPPEHLVWSSTVMYEGTYGPTFHTKDLMSWCHGIYEYAPGIDNYIRWARWGNSCDSKCGNPNEQLLAWQERQTLSARNSSYTPTICTSKNCAMCKYDDCWKMTNSGVCVS